MYLFYIYDEENIDSSFGLYDNEEAAAFVSERITNLADSPAVKELCTYEESESGVYYFVIRVSSHLGSFCCGDEIVDL